MLNINSCIAEENENRKLKGETFVYKKGELKIKVRTKIALK